MHLPYCGGNSKLLLKLLFNIANCPMKVSLRKHVRLTQQHKCGNSGFVEQSQRTDILFIERCSGIDQEKGKVAGG